MAFFNRNKGKIIDYSENYKVREKKSSNSIPQASSNTPISQTPSNEDYAPFGFLGSIASNSVDSSSSSNYSQNPNSYSSDSSSETNEEKRTKLAKRLLDMTNRIEDLSNQIYHLSQRLELVEKRLKISFE